MGDGYVDFVGFVKGKDSLSRWREGEGGEMGSAGEGCHGWWLEVARGCSEDAYVIVIDGVSDLGLA